MKTLIELFDERPFENVIGTETFRPARTIYICSPEVKANRSLQKKLKEYFQHRGIETECLFREAAVMNANNVASVLAAELESDPDCVLDITGGSESALFAAGMVCAEKQVPVITYSRKRNRFFNIRNAEFADQMPCDVHLTVEDSFRMAGGNLRQGRVDNAILEQYLEIIEPFFRLYLKYRRSWVDYVGWFQHVSQNKNGERPSLKVRGPIHPIRTHGRQLSIDPEVLKDFQKIGMLKDLILEEETVSFTFADQQVRTWLRDIGSVLELYVYKSAVETGRFDDVITSAVVDWEGNNSRDDVTNEIDVMATRGVNTFFISCKTCDVKTEALNELAILRDRFGGNMARAAIVTAEPGRIPMRHRAEELDIDVIDLNDLRTGHLKKRLIALTRE